MSQGKEIYRFHDEYGAIQVFDDGNKRYLAFGENDEQSCQLKSNPFQLQHDYAQAMLLVLLFKQPRSMVLLGLGGGTIAATLYHCLPELRLHVVELRQQVVAVAQRYFEFPRSKRIEVYVEDASEFLQRDDVGKVDVLFSDLYSEEGLDLQQTQAWFIESCADSLNDDGWLVLNCWQQHRGEHEMLMALETHFRDVRVCLTVEGNWVILAGKQASSLSGAQEKTGAKKWSKILGFSLASCFSRLKVLS